MKGVFKIVEKFLRIPLAERLGYLKAMDERQRRPYIIGWIDGGAGKQRRKRFDRIKTKRFPLGEILCYACDKNRAIHRHHVTPLNAGGRNKRNNLVPLCLECHEKIHPWMKRVN